MQYLNTGVLPVGDSSMLAVSTQLDSSREVLLVYQLPQSLVRFVEYLYRPDQRAQVEVCLNLQ